MSSPHKYAHYASKVKIFNGLGPEEIHEILHQGRCIEYRAGDSIFYKGQMGSNIFIVLNGSVNIENDGTMIFKCRAGDAIGEMSVLNHRPHSASANAASDVKMFILAEKDIHQILKKNHAAVTLLLNIIHVLSSYIENANSVIAKTGVLKSKKKGNPAS
jgi:CRP-like cAMP-binding protein